jgi:hypothetical protein
MAFRYSTKLFHDILDTIKTDMQDGIILLYPGSQPASPDDPATVTALGKITLAGGAFTAGSATNGLEFGTITDTGSGRATMAKASAEEWKFVCTVAGTVGWGRFIGNAVDANGTSTTLPRIDFACGISSGEARMSKLTYSVGETGVIESFNIPLTNIS